MSAEKEIMQRIRNKPRKKLTDEEINFQTNLQNKLRHPDDKKVITKEDVLHTLEVPKVKTVKEANEEQRYKEKVDSLTWNFNFRIDTIEDNARAILDKNPLYYDDFKQWWRWDEIQWVRVLPCDIIEFVKKVWLATGLSSSQNRTTILNALMDESRSRKPEQPKNTWIQFNNKIYDIASDEIIKPSPKYFMKLIIPIDVGDSEETPITDKIFKEWLEDDYEVLYDIIAYCISPTNFLDNFFFLVGAGSNGKSIFTSVINDFLSGDNTVDKNLDLISDPKQRFQAKDLKDKLLCNLGDGNFGVIKETKFLKEICGNKDKIQCEYKGSNNTVSFYSTSTVLGSFNTLPQTADKSPGFYRRAHITEFKKQFDGKTKLDNTMFQSEYSNLAFRSLNRIKEIYKTQELKGWGEIEDRKEKYEKLSNLIRQFMNSEMIEDYKGCFTKTVFHKEYRKWAVKNGRNELEFKDCINRLEAQSIDYHRRIVHKAENGFIYGRIEDVPDELKLMDEKEEYVLLEKVNINVFNGYSFKKQKK